MLSHYYLDCDHPSPYFKAGLLLPDLVRGFNEKLRRSVFATEPVCAEHRYMAEGVRKHYAVDRLFHQSETFLSAVRQVSGALLPELFPSFQHRRYFMAHVLVEMLLDRLLMKHAPHLCVKMKSDLEKTDTGVLQSYFRHIGKPVVQKDFFDNFNRLLSSTPLLFYLNNEKFVMALVRVYQKINPAQANRTEVERLATLVSEMESAHRERLPAIFETLNESLAAHA